MGKGVAQNKYPGAIEMYDKMQWMQDSVKPQPVGIAKAFEKAGKERSLPKVRPSKK